MKRLNLILISETAAPDTNTEVIETVDVQPEAIVVKDGDITPDMITPEMESQLRALDGLLEQYPDMANDPEIKKLVDIQKMMSKSAPQTSVQNKQDGGNQSNNQNVGDNKGDDNKDSNKTNSLSSLPFFGSIENKIDPSKIKIESFGQIAPEFKIDTSKDDWFGNFVAESVGLRKEFESYKAKVEEQDKVIQGLEALPKELATSIKEYIAGKDWRSVLNISSNVLDYNKDFSSLTKEEKIKIHNYYFPDDKLDETASDSDKIVIKSLKAAEAAFNSDKTQVAAKIDAQRLKKENDDKLFIQSVEDSISKLKADYPNFDNGTVKNIETILKTNGVASLLYNQDGTARPDIAKRVAFLLHGEDVLKAAVAIAENKGKSDGKSELLKTNIRENNGGQRNNLTDEEKHVEKIVRQSTLANNLTY